jgi:hypothetical protein
MLHTQEEGKKPMQIAGENTTDMFYNLQGRNQHVMGLCILEKCLKYIC